MATARWRGCRVCLGNSTATALPSSSCLSRCSVTQLLATPACSSHSDVVSVRWRGCMICWGNSSGTALPGSSCLSRCSVTQLLATPACSSHSDVVSTRWRGYMVCWGNSSATVLPGSSCLSRCSVTYSSQLLQLAVATVMWLLQDEEAVGYAERTLQVLRCPVAPVWVGAVCPVAHGYSSLQYPQWCGCCKMKRLYGMLKELCRYCVAR